MTNRRIAVFVIIASIGVLSFLAYIYDQMYDCLNPPMWIKHPMHYELGDCIQMYVLGTLPDYTQIRENYAKEQAHRNDMVESFSDLPEVVAFYEKHGDDAKVSVRYDHVSYFAKGSESFHPRMNLHYDENNALTQMRFYCFDDTSVQYEVAQEDIVYYLKNKDCVPKNLSENPSIELMSNRECANLFDSSWSAWIVHAASLQTNGAQMEPPSKQDIISGSEFFAEFRDTDCRFTVNDWAYLIEDQSIVWDDIPWPKLRTYPHEYIEPGDVMILEAFPKSNPLNGYHFIHQIKHGEHQYLWDAVQHGNAILDFDEADQFHREFVDKSNKFEMQFPDGTSQIWSMSYGEKQIQNDRHFVEAIVFASDIPGDAPNIPYVEISEEMIPIVFPLAEREKQFRYQEVSYDDAVKIYRMLDENGIMFTMNNEKLFLKYLGPLLELENLDTITSQHFSNERNVFSLPFGMTSEEFENQTLIDPIYIENPNNPGELILDIDSMIQVKRIFDKCDYAQKLRSGEIPAQNPDGSYNAIPGELRFYQNGTHYVDSNNCEWIDSLEAMTYNCFEIKPTARNWHLDPDYFTNKTHYIDSKDCQWITLSYEKR